MPEDERAVAQGEHLGGIVFDDLDLDFALEALAQIVSDGSIGGFQCGGVFEGFHSEGDFAVGTGVTISGFSAGRTGCDAEGQDGGQG